MSKIVTFDDVKEGDWLMDEYGRICVVENKYGNTIETRRYEYGKFWSGFPCPWNKKLFNSRRWYKTRNRMKQKEYSKKYRERKQQVDG